MANIEISTWYWLILGLVLIIGEVLLPGSLLIWLGLGAALVGIISIAVKLSLVVKLAIWAGTTGILIVLWFKVFRDNDSTRAGRAEATVGYTGQLMREVAPKHPGAVRFSRPILGEDVWECESDQRIASNSMVKVVAVVGREGRRVKVLPIAQ